MPPSPLEQEFDAAMREIYRRAYTELGYNGTVFFQMLESEGGVETARSLLHTRAVSEGYTKLWEHHRLDLTLEAVIFHNPRFHSLFSPEEIGIATRRLISHEYPPAVAARNQGAEH